jgi:tyrosyl-tRNA synthetase
MTPIIEGLDGVQKMSKSLNNAIGIHELPQEMYGKLMSISDQLMWRYWTLLTDMRQSEIDKMQADVASGTLHPMDAKKRLARTIVAGFHGPEAAQAADENWARQFQQKSDDVEGLEEVRIPYADIAGTTNDGVLQIRVPKLIVRAGLAQSGAEATRKLAENAVRIDGETISGAAIQIAAVPARITVRVGKRVKIAAIE